MAELDDELRKAMMEATARHARFPEVSFDAYRQARYEALKAFVSTRRTVYLDLNFWISLRNPSKAKKPKESADLLDILRNGVKAGRLLCPVSYAVFVELMKQKQSGDGRVTLARLMDDLSMGVGLRNSFDTARIEYLRFFSQHVPRLAKYIDSVWAPIGHLTHEVYPYQDELPHEFMERSRKVMCDVIWARKMEHLAKRDLPEYSGAAAERINSALKLNPRGNKPFSRLFSDELEGIIEQVHPYIEEVLQQMASAGFNSTEIEVMEKQRTTAANNIRRVATHSDGNTVPSQRIYAALHAAMRLNPDRLYDANDPEDFEHASVAVGYCDLFLTDKRLSVLLSDSNVKKVIPSRCKVFGFSDFESANTYISSLRGIEQEANIDTDARSQL